MMIDVLGLPMDLFLIISFPLAFIVHDVEEIVVQHKWMLTHKEDLLRRFPRARRIVFHLSGLSTKAFSIAVLEELVLLLIATAYILVGEPCAKELWIALFLAFSIHFVIHLVQGIIVRDYVPGLITSILLIPYSLFCIDCICGETSYGKIALLAAIGLATIAANLRFAHWLGNKLS